VLTATPHSYEKGQNSTLHKIKTHERVLTKFDTVDYVPEICLQIKFGSDRFRRGLLGKYVKYTMFVTFFLFFPNRPGGHTRQPVFTQNDLNDVAVASRIDVPFAVKIETFSNP